MSVDRVDFHHQVAALAVDEQCAGLEHRLFTPSVEVLEGHEVLQQGHQAAFEAQQLVQFDQAVGGFGHLPVLADQRQ
ncbi:hypothetical protein D3C77_719690 [compost metagenome]